jgi:hypothetical protein
VVAWLTNQEKVSNYDIVKVNEEPVADTERVPAPQSSERSVAADTTQFPVTPSARPDGGWLINPIAKIVHTPITQNSQYEISTPNATSTTSSPYDLYGKSVLNKGPARPKEGMPKF